MNMETEISKRIEKLEEMLKTNIGEKEAYAVQFCLLEMNDLKQACQIR